MSESIQSAGVNVESPGAMLAAARRAARLEMDQVAHSLHVSESFIAALESDRFESLGAPIFVKGHIRNYAKLLQLDAADILRAYAATADARDPELVARPHDGIPMQTRDYSWLGTVGGIVLFLLLAGSAGWWYYNQEKVSGEQFAITANEALIPPVTNDEAVTDDETTPLEDGTGSSELSLMTTTVPAETGTQGEIELASPGDTTSETERDDAPAVAAPATVQPSVRQPATEPVASAEQAGTSAVAEQPTATAGHSIRFAFAEESWIEVYDADDRPLMYDLMPAGTQRTVTAFGPVRVFLGNAPAVTIEVAGETFPLARFIRRDNTARFNIER